LVMAAVFVAIPHEEPALGLAMETMGSDQPVAEQVDWAEGVIDVVDLPSRVYSRWVNGNESFYYRGATEDLNATLRNFAAVKADVREVILRPGPGEARTWDGLRVPCDWRVHVPSGIYLAMAKEEKGTRVFTKHATMTVFVSGGNIELEKLQIPAGVTVLELKDLVERYLAGLKSKDHDVRGQAAYLLGEMGPYVEEVILPLVEALKDENEYVRRCAAIGVGRMGARALAALPTLRQGLQDEDEHVREAFREAIAKIEGAESEEAREHRAVREQIHKFRKRDWPLARADAAIREGLEELAKKFPQLEKARDWEEVTSERSEAGRISILLAHPPPSKGATSDELVPEAERYRLLVSVQTPPSQPYQQIAMFGMYPNLGLVGEVRADAGDPELEAALSKLAVDALAPLRRLDDEAARTAQADEPSWGEAVEGAQCKLRADKLEWKVGETPSFQADVRNGGERKLVVHLSQTLCELEFDGQWYAWAGEVRARRSGFGLGRYCSDIRIALDDQWRSKPDHKPVPLSVGKHTVRVAFTAQPSKPDEGAAVRFVSNPVEIEILALDEKEKALIACTTGRRGIRAYPEKQPLSRRLQQSANVH